MTTLAEMWDDVAGHLPDGMDEDEDAELTIGNAIAMNKTFFCHGIASALRALGEGADAQKLWDETMKYFAERLKNLPREHDS